MSQQLNGPTVELAGNAGLSESQRHELLANERRRLAMETLSTAELPLDLDTLARMVAADEDGTTATGLQTVERVKISLHHVHVPKLSDAGLLEYDLDARRITEQHVELTAARE